MTVDITANATDATTPSDPRAVDGVDGVHVHRVSDRTFLMHLKGKLEVRRPCR
jgi:malate dehydrogenase (oxaloacetate-decarboxylating)